MTKMTVNINQNNATIQNQYIAEEMNFDAVRTSSEFVQQLKNLQAELNKAIAAKAISGENAIQAEEQFKNAIDQAGKPTPDKKSLVEYLTSAKDLVSNVTGLTVSITGAIAAVGSLL
jgi:hypothetical protein